LCLIACHSPPETKFFAADNYPAKLSAWGVLSSNTFGILVAKNSAVYDLNSALFTDYALKLRTIHLPQHSSGRYQPFAAFDLPTGTVISKTFFYQIDANGSIKLDGVWNGNPSELDSESTRLIETRLLIKQEHGWDALPYVWHGKDADLAITGALLSLPVAQDRRINYLVPSRNQCAGCHATDHSNGEILPIGIKARHLNKKSPVTHQAQLLEWQNRGWLSHLPKPTEIPRNAPLYGSSELEHRARSYLDINCGHCHSTTGAADTSGLFLDYRPHDAASLGVCKPPIAAGKGTGGHLYSIVPGKSNESILSFRIKSEDPASMMPELGRSLSHTQGARLIDEWIDSLAGQCR